MLGHVVAADPAAVVGLNDLQSVLDVLLQGEAAVVHMIEHAEFHTLVPFKADWRSGRTGLDTIAGNSPL